MDVRQPIDVGRIIRRTFEIYVDQANVLLPASAVVFVISGILLALLAAGSPGLALLGLVISFVAVTLFTGMVVELVSDVQDGRRDATAGQLVRAVNPVLGSLILVGIVAGLGEAIGLVLVIVPGLVLLTWWAVAAPVVVLERPPGLRALGRSRELVRGNGMQVFSVIIVFFVLTVVVGLIIEGAAASAGAGAGLVAQVVVSVLLRPLAALAAAVLYFELRSAPAAVQPLAPAAPFPTGGPPPPAEPAAPEPVAPQPARAPEPIEPVPPADEPGKHWPDVGL